MNWFPLVTLPLFKLLAAAASAALVWVIVTDVALPMMSNFANAINAAQH